MVGSDLSLRSPGRSLYPLDSTALKELIAMKRFSPALLFLVALASPTVAQEPLEVELAEPVVSVPMDTTHSHVGLEIYLGEEGPFWVNLDTYAVTVACIDAEFAKQMGYRKVGTTRNGDGSGAYRTLDVVLIPELRLGGATFTNIRALADDYAYLENPEGGPLRGLLGYHLFRDLLLELDYTEGRVVLQRGELAKDDPHVITHSALRERPDLPIRMGGEELIVGIDSGAQSGLSIPFARMSELELLSEPVKVGSARTVYSSAPIWVSQLVDPLHIAGHRIENFEGTFSEIFGKTLIGYGLLKEYSVTFDQKRGRVRFLGKERAAARTEAAPLD